MEQDILQILEFNEIRRMLAQLCPSSLSKAKAMDLQPSSEPRIIAEHLQETEEVHESGIRYLNRLSDLCFTLSRYETEVK